MNNVKNLKNKIKKLSRYLLNDILEYRKEILKSYNPFYLVAYKNLENIFQDIKQINFYKTKQQFYNDFYIKYFNKFYSNALIKPIILDAANIMKYFWKDGKGTPLPPEKCYENSMCLIKNDLKTFFETVFITVFTYSPVYNKFVDEIVGKIDIEQLEFFNEETFVVQLTKLHSQYFLEKPFEKEIDVQEKIFYNKAINRIINNIFYFGGKSKTPIQTHQYFLRGIELDNFECKINSKTKIRNIKINEMERFCSKYSFADNKCVIEHKYKITSEDMLVKPLLIPIVVKLYFKNCAILTKANNYINCNADGITDELKYNIEYDGSVPVCIKQEFLNNFNNVINLSQYYIDNIENKEILFIKIAIDFYMQAIDKIHPTHQITYCCLALEALYNTSTDKIIKQLTERCARILSRAIDLEEKIIIKNLKKAYEIRCSYVHAQNPNCSINDELSSAIFDYTRYSILIFLTLIKSANFYKKYSFRCPKWSFKKYVNEYYLNNIEIMKNLEKELINCLNKISWIKKLSIEKEFCKIRDYMLDLY